MFLTGLSVSLSVSPLVLHFCLRNSSLTNARNFIKLCWYLRHNFYMCILPGYSNIFNFLEILPFELEMLALG